jgi:hypothetical protein
MANIGWSNLKRLLIGLFISVTLLALPASVGVTAAPTVGTQDVLYVGNNWDGTADVIDVRSFTRLARINIIPDTTDGSSTCRVPASPTSPPST